MKSIALVVLFAAFLGAQDQPEPQAIRYTLYPPCLTVPAAEVPAPAPARHADEPEQQSVSAILLPLCMTGGLLTAAVPAKLYRVIDPASFPSVTMSKNGFIFLNGLLLSLGLSYTQVDRDDGGVDVYFNPGLIKTADVIIVAGMGRHEAIREPLQYRSSDSDAAARPEPPPAK